MTKVSKQCDSTVAAVVLPFLSHVDYTPLNNYVTMQPSLMRCGTPPNNDADQQGMYMSIDREALEGR